MRIKEKFKELEKNPLVEVIFIYNLGLIYIFT